ncbi:MAG: hypothetical protein ACYTAF_02320 [Planctomycetota bacterium]|jgi:hypothetical protein
MIAWALGRKPPGRVDILIEKSCKLFTNVPDQLLGSRYGPVPPLKLARSPHWFRRNGSLQGASWFTAQ